MQPKLQPNPAPRAATVVMDASARSTGAIRDEGERHLSTLAVMAATRLRGLVPPGREEDAPRAEVDEVPVSHLRCEL